MSVSLTYKSKNEAQIVSKYSFAAYHKNSLIINGKNENLYSIFGICLNLSQ